MRQKLGTTRKIGSLDICQNCGGKYIVKSGNQKYCSTCAPEMLAEIDRIQGLEYYDINKGRINPIRMVSRRKCATCEKCGEPINATGGRRFCISCEATAKKELYWGRYVERNIIKRGNSYIVYANHGGRRYYIKATTDHEIAIRLRDHSEKRSKMPDFCAWLSLYKNAKRPLIENR